MTGDILQAVRGLAPRVRELGPEIEEGRRLPVGLAEEFGRVGLWRSCVPVAAGGVELHDLNALLGAFSALGAADGSAGWCAMIGATSGLIYGYIDPRAAKTIVEGPDFCTGGVFAPSGRAIPAEGGFRVSGRWSFASGVHHSTWLGLGIVVMDGDAIAMQENDAPDVRGVLVPASEVEVVDTWYVSGLRGTGSNDVVMEDVFVPSERVYQLVGGAPKAEDTLYAFPVFGLLALGVSSVAVGIARDALHELRSLASQKTPSGSRRRLADRSHVQMEIAQAHAELASAEAFVENEVGRVWETAEAGDRPDVEARARLRLAATHATRTAARVVDRMYEAGGGTSIYAGNRLQRASRDVHAATQHMVVSPATYELAGRVLMGVETDLSQL